MVVPNNLNVKDLKFFRNFSTVHQLTSKFYENSAVKDARKIHLPEQLLGKCSLITYRKKHLVGRSCLAKLEQSMLASLRSLLGHNLPLSKRLIMLVNFAYLYIFDSL